MYVYIYTYMYVYIYIYYTVSYIINTYVPYTSSGQCIFQTKQAGACLLLVAVFFLGSGHISGASMISAKVWPASDRTRLNSAVCSIDLKGSS